MANIGLCLEMVLLKDSFEERVRKAAEAGFKNVEFWWVDGTYKGSPDGIVELARKHKVRFTDTAANSPDGTKGGGLTDPKTHAGFLERVRVTLGFNKEADIPATIVLTGNIIPGMTESQMRKAVVEGLKPAVDLAEKAGVTLLLEPLNDKVDHPNYWLTSSDKGAEIVREIGSKRLRLLFDCYHMQIMEGDVVKHIERNIDVIGHFHSAGVPGRNELFRGETNYPFVIRQIDRLGYQGAFGLEYMPSMDDLTSMKKSLAHVTEE
jgi:hydroxypyruvate isomerase